MWNPSSIFSFIDYAFGIKSKNQQTQSCLDFLLYYLYEFYSLCFTFRSMIHLEKTFIKCVKSMSRFLFYVERQMFQHICWKDCLFPHQIAFALLLIITWLHLSESNSGLSIWFYSSIYLFFSQYCILLATVLSSSQVISIFWFCSCPSILCWLLWIFCLSLWVLEVIDWYTWNKYWDLD